MDEKRTLLIVDDDTSNLMELTHILRDEYKIYIVKDGPSALEKAKESLPDLILLDIIMPGMSGFDVFSKLQETEETANIPVIFITGLNDGESRGLAFGAVDYIRKPFDTTVVKLRVGNQMKIINLQYHLKKALKAAESASEYKSSFLASVGHEIRTPMNAIMGITEILLDNQALPNNVIDNLQKIATSGNMLMTFIDELSDLSQIEAGKYKITPVEYDLAGMIKDVININIIRIEKKPVIFQLNILGNIPAYLFGDETRIKQILNNLLSNAFKYTKDGKVELNMSWEAQNEKNILVMSVKDTGYGMNDEQLDVLFEDYSRFTPERDGIKIEGTGLGLAITKRLVMLMGADISVESKQGEGSCFTVRLPQGVIGDKILDKETIEMLQSRETHDDPEEKFNGTILIVDDLEINLYVAKAVMDSFGLNVDIALSGGEAIDKINNGNAYDIIFMDYMMPQMNGVETVKHLRDMGYDAPIVALTADTATEKAEMFIENGFDGTIVKPIDARQVNHILRRYIQN